MQNKQGVRARRASRNGLGSGAGRRARAVNAAIERLEQRVLLSTANWLGGTGNWNQASNWSDNAVPLSGDTANITVSGSVVNVTDAERSTLIMTAAGTTLNLSGGSTLQFDDGGTISGALTLGVGAQIAQGGNPAFPLVFAGTTTMAGLFLGGFYTNTGTINATAADLYSGTLTNNGTFNIAGGFNVGTNLVNGMTGTVNLQDDGGLTGNGTLTNDGTLDLNGGTGTANLNSVEINDLGGTITVQSGTLAIAQTSYFNNATFTISSGAAFAFDPISSTNNGDSFYFIGTNTGTGAGNLLFNGGNAQQGNPNSPAAPSVINFASGMAEITGTGFVDSNYGYIINEGFLNYIGSSQHGPLGLENEGTIDVTGTGDLAVGSGGVFDNAANGILDFEADASITNPGGGSASNEGLIEKTAGTGASSIGVTYISYTDTGGTIEAQTGTIDFPTGGVFQGTTFNASTGASISFDDPDPNGGTDYRFAGTITGNGGGHVLFASDNATTGGDATTAAIFNFPTGFAQVSGTGFLVGNSGFNFYYIINEGFLNYIGSSQHGLLGLENEGTIDVTGTGDLAVSSGGAFDNAATGILNFEADGGVTNAGGNTAFTNEGLIEKTGGTGVSSIGVIGINNTDTGDTIDAQTGTIDFPTGGVFQGTTLNASTGATISFDDPNNGGYDYRFAGTISGSGGGHVLFASDDATTGGDATSAAIINFPVGFAQVTGGAGFVVSNYGYIINEGFLNYIGSSQHGLFGLENEGTIDVTGTGDLAVSSGGAFDNAATGILNFEADAGVTNAGGNTAFTNEGTIEKTGGTGDSVLGPGTNGISFSNQGGGFNIQTGSLSITNGGGGFHWIAGPINVSAGANLNFGSGNATIYFSGTFTSTGAGNVNFVGGSLYGLGNSNPIGTLDFAPGVFVDTGGVFQDNTNLTNVGTIQTSGPVTLGSLDNQGTVVFTDAGPLTISAGTINNDASGIFDFAADQTITITGNNGFNNAGTLEKTAGSGSLDLSAYDGFFTNTGTIRAHVGTIVLPDSRAAFGSNSDTIPASATFEADTNATIALPSGSTPITINDGTVILKGAGASFPAISSLTTNNGTFKVLSGASFTTSGDLTNTGTLTVGGTLTVTGNFVESGTPILNFAVAAAAGSAGAPDFTVDGMTTLAGDLTAAYAGGFGSNSGSYTVANFAIAATGTFAGTSGVGPAFTTVVSATSIVLNAAAQASADLAVTSVSAPTTFSAGQTTTITWNVANQGQADANGSWIDSVYLSKTRTFSTAAVDLGTATHTGPLTALSNYQGSLSVTLPAVAAGRYHILVITDTDQDVSDSNRANNLGASSATTATIPVLTLGGSVSGTISVAEGLLYQLAIPGGRDVVVSETSAVPLENQLDISDGTVPTIGSGQYSATLAPGSTTTTVELRLPQAGTYYLLLSGDVAAGSGQSFTLAAAAVPFAVTGASPNTVGQGSVTVNVTGSGFTSGSTVELVSGGTTVATGIVTLLNPDDLSVTFDLTSVAAATYGVTVTSGTNTATLASAVTVQAATTNIAPVNYTLSAPTDIRPNRIYDLFITYTNPNNVDVAAPVFELDEPNLEFKLVSGDPAAHIQAGAAFTTGELQLLAINQEGVAGILPAGYTGTYEIAFEAPNAGGDSTFTPSINDYPDGTDSIDLSSFLANSSYSSLTWSILAAEMNGLTSLPTSTVNGQTGYPVDATLQPEDLSVTGAGFDTDLGNIASTLSKAGVYDPDTYDLLNYALGAADQFGAVTQRQTFGATLSLTPGFGSFGQGTPDPLYYAVNYDSTDGIYNVVMPSVTESFAVNTSGSGSAFRPTDSSDSSVFSIRANSTYRVTAQDGSFYQFNASNRLAFFQNVNGQRTIFNYTNGHVTSVVDPVIGATTFTYDPTYGVVTSSTDPYGRTTTYGYEYDSSLGVEFGTANPRANIPLLKTITTSAGTTTITYEPTPVLQYTEITSIDPIDDSPVITFYYSWTSNPALAYLPATISLPDGSGEMFSYDNFGRLTQTSLLDGSDAVTFSYDASGLQQTTTADGNSSSNIVSYQGSILESTDPNGAVTNYSYNSGGLLSSVLSPTGAVTSFAYNADGTNASQTNALGDTSSTTYDSGGRPVTLTDGDGNVVGLAYDSHGNLQSITQPNSTAQQYQYTSAGLLSRITQQNGVIASIGYNPQGQIISESFSSGDSYAYAYDPQGNLTTATGPAGMTKYTYTPTNFVKTVTGPDGHTIKYTYNSLGELASVSNSGAVVTNYTYDTDARIKKVTDGSGNLVVKYQYDVLGRISMETFGNGTSTVYAYNAAGQVLSITNLNATSAITSSLAYTYDATGNPLTVTDASNNVTHYAYDLLGQLTQVTLPGGGVITYTYDADGDRTSAVNSGTTTSYTVNNMDQYTAVGMTTYTYDQNGNMTSMTDGSGTTNYTYNANNQLVTANGPGGDFTYTYDALNQLIAYTKNGVLTNLVRGPNGAVVAAYDSSGNLLANFTYGAGLIAQSGGSAGTLYYDFDATGNTIATADASGTTVNTYSYLPFGEQLSATGPSGNLFTFNGRNGVLDLGDGMYQTKLRTYSPALGRFIQPDPTVYAAGSLNLYQYANNQPLTKIDPTGALSQGAQTALYGGIAAVGSLFVGLLAVEAKIQAKILAQQLAADLATGGANAVATEVEVPIQEVVYNGEALVEAAQPYLGEVVGYFAENPQTLLALKNALLRGTLGVLFFLGPTPAHADTQNPPQDNNPEDPWTPDPDLYGPAGGKIFGTPAQRQAFYAYVNRRRRQRAAQRINGRVSGDPNDIFGPAGYGTSGYVAPATFPYTVEFENEHTANAAAQNVVITQQLSSNLDWSTFALGSFGFGSYNVTVPPALQSYDTHVDATATVGVIVDVNASFNPNTGVLTWTFTSLDPTTLLPVTSALAGFLPPNNSSGQGKGYVSYTVQPKTSDTTGAVINAQAQVVFDTNAALDTPLLANTIDSGAPTSSVTALAATESFTGFLVSWSGQDDASGSGIAYYDIYVSDNGGAFTPWLSNATFTSSTYPGQAGHSYGFYSVATDNVGNIQETPSAAQATTTVAADAAATFATLTNGALVVDGTAGSDTITLQTDGSGNLTATLNGQTSESLPLSQIASIDVEGEAGSDTITLGAGVPAASVQGGRGKDIINGGAGDDTLAGGRGADVITAGSGNDLLRGGRGADSLVAGSGNDTLLGGAGDDTLHGGAGDDLLNGNAGTNKLRGGAGNNTFYAVSGTDDQIFVGSAANDSLFYGAGDQFVIESGSIPPGNQTLVS